MFHVQCEIAKPKARSLNISKYLKKQQEWSPWETRKPNDGYKFTGVKNGEVGAIHVIGSGNKDVGEGEQENLRQKLLKAKGRKGEASISLNTNLNPPRIVI